MGNKRRSDAKRIQNLLIILAILTEFDISVKKPHFVLTCGIRQVKVQKEKQNQYHWHTDIFSCSALTYGVSSTEQQNYARVLTDYLQHWSIPLRTEKLLPNKFSYYRYLTATPL